MIGSIIYFCDFSNVTTFILGHPSEILESLDEECHLCMHDMRLPQAHLFLCSNVRKALLETFISFCRTIMEQLKPFSVIIHWASHVVWFAQLVTCVLVDATYMLLRRGLSILVACSSLLLRYAVRKC